MSATRLLPVLLSLAAIAPATMSTPAGQEAAVSAPASSAGSDSRPTAAPTAARSEPAGTAMFSARDGWIRAAPPVAKVRAGYLVIDNDGDADVAIDRVDSDAFGAIEIHEMHEVDGVMQMRRVPSLRVPARGSVELKPGGLHLMLFRPVRLLGSGDAVEVRLHAGDTVHTLKLVVAADG